MSTISIDLGLKLTTEQRKIEGEKMEYASGLIRLKPGTEDKVEEWRNTISSRFDEAAATLQDENVYIESWFKIEIKGERYLLWHLSQPFIMGWLHFHQVSLKLSRKSSLSSSLVLHFSRTLKP